MSISRVFALVLGLVLLAFGQGGPAVALAQDATPAAEAGAADPAVGTEVPYLDENGEEIAVLTVRELTDPFDDLAEGSAPEEGSRYVAVEIAVRATGETIEPEPFDFGLQTADGFFFSRASVTREISSSDVPDLETIPVDIDDEVSGLVFFQIPADAEPSRLLWQPETGRLLVLAEFDTTEPGTLARR